MDDMATCEKLTLTTFTMTKKIYSLIFAAVFLLTGCGQPATNTTGTALTKVKIGMIAPLTGDAAALGSEMKKVAEYVLPSLNEKYKSQGYEFEVVYEDGKCAGGSSTTAFSKLSDIDGVKFVFGGACSSESLGIAPLLAEKHVLAVSATSSNPDLEGKSPYLFSLSYSDSAIADGLIAELSKYKKVALISEQNDYNAGLRQKVVEALKAQKIEIVADEEFPKGSIDVRNVLQKVKATSPDVLFINPNVGATAETFVRQLAEIKGWNVPKVSIFSLMSDNVLKAAPEVLEGTIVVDVPFVNDKDFLAYRDAIVAAKGSMDDLGNFYTATSVDAVNLLAELIVKSGNDVEKAKTMLGTDTFQGRIGTITFKGKTFVQGIKSAKYEIKNGKTEQLQ